MLTAIHPKLPMRDHSITKQFYVDVLGFRILGDPQFQPYMMVQKDLVEVHFFLFPELDPLENYGQVYIRVSNIEELYKEAIVKKISIPALGHLSIKPWCQQEFSITDPDHNLITFGSAV